ncbi:HAD-IA family hydrolase [Photobacterium chitinilyticum]|uniref:HAD family hydrolase n=1 Tax=Photobacterium chitinilyticum TaxID=2485123 RepID=UPI003D1108B4
MKVRGILLDLDDTLYDYNVAHRFALEKAIDEVVKKFELDRDKTIWAFNKAKIKIKTMLPIAAAGHDRLLYFQHMFEILNINPFIFSYEASEIYWTSFFEKMTLTSDAIEFLDNTKDIPICLVTDLTADIQFRKIKKLNLDNRITSIVTSEEAGVEKPHPFPFLYAMKKLHCKSDEVIMIGDSLKKDILGATSLGIKSFLINRSHSNNDKIIAKEYSTIRFLTDIEVN